MIPKIIGIHKLATILDCTPASIYSHISRKNWDAIPQPIRMGTRLAWPQTVVDEWFDKKLKESMEGNEKTDNFTPKRIGRPTKREAIRQRRKERVNQ